MALQKYTGPFGAEFLRSIRDARREQADTQAHFPGLAVEAHRSQELAKLGAELSKAGAEERKNLLKRMREVYAERFVIGKVAHFRPHAIRKVVSLLRALGKAGLRVKSERVGRVYRDTGSFRAERKQRIKFLFAHGNARTVVQMRFNRRAQPSFEIYDPQNGHVYQLVLGETGLAQPGVFFERRSSYKHKSNRKAKDAFFRLGSIAGLGNKELGGILKIAELDEFGPESKK